MKKILNFGLAEMFAIAVIITCIAMPIRWAFAGSPTDAEIRSYVRGLFDTNWPAPPRVRGSNFFANVAFQVGTNAPTATQSNLNVIVAGGGTQTVRTVGGSILP